ncbi:hypothetical protein C8Q78DRAFT_1040887 [Trametes maxima]|nr:hypothetical protein C8Q78DRAFT_1040887 [Trametes maxima]
MRHTESCGKNSEPKDSGVADSVSVDAEADRVSNVVGSSQASQDKKPRQLKIFKYLDEHPNPGTFTPVNFLADFPPLPSGCDTVNYYHILGWPITERVERRLQNHFRHSRRRARKEKQDLTLVHFPGFRDLDRGLLELRGRARYKDIYDYDVVPLDCDDPENAPRMQILTIWHTERILSLYRPTHAVYLWLCAVLGSEPQWYIDPIPQVEWDTMNLLTYCPEDPELEFYMKDQWIAREWVDVTSQEHKDGEGSASSVASEVAVARASQV